MGMLLPVLIRMDDWHSWREDPEQLVERISEATHERRAKSLSYHHKAKRPWWQFWKPKYAYTAGGSCNSIESLGVSDAMHNRVVVIHGNTWIDIGDYIYRLKDLAKGYDPSNVKKKYLKTCLDIAKRQIKDIEAELKSLEGQGE